MKLIIAIIKPFKLEEVKEALAEARHRGMTVTEVKGFRPPDRPHRDLSEGSEYTVDFLPKVKIEIAVADDMAGKAVGDREIGEDRQDRRRQGLPDPPRGSHPYPHGRARRGGRLGPILFT